MRSSLASSIFSPHPFSGGRFNRATPTLADGNQIASTNTSITLIPPYKSCANFSRWYIDFITKVFEYNITNPQGLVEQFAILPQQNICSLLLQVMLCETQMVVMHTPLKFLNVL